jgi:hypothetical protein
LKTEFYLKIRKSCSDIIKLNYISYSHGGRYGDRILLGYSAALMMKAVIISETSVYFSETAQG